MARKKVIITEEEPDVVEITIPSDADVVKAIKRLMTLKKAAQSANGEVGAFMKRLSEDKDFDPWAAGVALRLESMPQEKLAIKLPHLDAYINALGLRERASQQADMFDVDAEPPANVRRLREPREVEEVA